MTEVRPNWGAFMNMNRAWNRTAATLAVSCLLLCGPLLAGGRAVRHSLGFENRGSGAVTDVRIGYGEYEFPMSLLRDHMSPGAHRTEIRSLPIPDVAEISWISADGVKHEISCPVRSLIRDQKRFRGFLFRFVDAVLEIDLLESPVDLDWSKGLAKTRIFSSAPP